MSTDATSPGKTNVSENTSSPDKGKGKSKPDESDASMELEEGEEEDEEEEEDANSEEDEDDDELEEDPLDEIDPTAIRGRRTRGVRVDYTSPEALAKAGLKAGGDEDDSDTEMKD